MIYETKNPKSITKNSLRLISAITCLFFLSFASGAQKKETQFPKAWELQMRLQNGMITNFHSDPDLYAGGIVFAPQYGLVPHKLRAGAVAGFIYAGKKINGLVGPSVALKLKSFQTGLFGFGNIHLSAEHLWGSNNIRLLGGGPHIELAHKIALGFTAHRDYKNNSWWFQSHIAIKLNKMKTDDQDFN
jgi:hypothetical protein